MLYFVEDEGILSKKVFSCIFAEFFATTFLRIQKTKTERILSV